MKTRVIIADAQTAVRQLLACCLTCRHGCTVVGEARTGHEAIKLCRKLKPALLVLDVALPELNGVEALRAVRKELPDLKVLVFSGARDEVLPMQALEAKPHGFVHKEDSLDVLNEALGAVLRGCRFYTPFASRLSDASSLRKVSGDYCTGRAALTQRERCVLQMVACSLTSKQIAERMDVSPKTVDHHRAALMRKVGVRDVAGLTRYAFRAGLLSEE